MLNKLITSLLFIVVYLPLYSQNNVLEEKVKKQINYNEDDFLSFDLKQFPNNNQLSIAAISKYNGEKVEDGFECSLILLLINTKSGEIINKYTDKTLYGSDAYVLTGFYLDMANYSVSDNQRAFGVRHNHRGSSNVNPSSDENLSLYILKNNEFNKILEDYEVENFVGENDTRCKSESVESKSILIIQKHKTSNYNNILIKTKVRKTKSTASKNDESDCIETIKESKPTYKTLVFKNGKYQ